MNLKDLVLMALNARGLNQTQLAREIGKSQTWVSRAVSGRCRVCEPEVLKKLQEMAAS